MMSLPLARVFQSLVTFTYVMCWLAEIWQLWRRATGPVSGVRIEECGAKEEKTWFPGFSPTRPPERERERALSLSRSAGRVGENPGNEVEEESEKKTKEEKRAREREGNLPSLSPLPHPLVVVIFFFLLTSFFAVATAGLPVASRACDRPVNGQFQWPGLSWHKPRFSEKLSVESCFHRAAAAHHSTWGSLLIHLRTWS